MQVLGVTNAVAAGLPAPAPVSLAFIGGMPISEDQKRLRGCALCYCGCSAESGGVLALVKGLECQVLMPLHRHW